MTGHARPLAPARSPGPASTVRRPRSGRRGGGWWSAWPSSSAPSAGSRVRGLTGSFVYYLTPTDIAVGQKAQVDQRVRLGGYVVPGQRAPAGGHADLHGDRRRRRTMEVLSTGPVPQMFRAGQGVVLEGALGRDGRFHSDTLLVKHDGEYRGARRTPGRPGGGCMTAHLGQTGLLHRAAAVGLRHARGGGRGPDRPARSRGERPRVRPSRCWPWWSWSTAPCSAALLTNDFTLRYVARELLARHPDLLQGALPVGRRRRLAAAVEPHPGRVRRGGRVAVPARTTPAPTRTRRRAPRASRPSTCCSSTAPRGRSPPSPWLPVDGRGPSPLLQNHPLMAVHPPFLYLGFIGFTVPFAFGDRGPAGRVADRSSGSR